MFHFSFDKNTLNQSYFMQKTPKWLKQGKKNAVYRQHFIQPLLVMILLFPLQHTW
jgi:hypothetical protein